MAFSCSRSRGVCAVGVQTTCDETRSPGRPREGGYRSQGDTTPIRDLFEGRMTTTSPTIGQVPERTDDSVWA